MFLKDGGAGGCWEGEEGCTTFPRPREYACDGIWLAPEKVGKDALAALERALRRIRGRDEIADPHVRVCKQGFVPTDRVERQAEL